MAAYFFSLSVDLSGAFRLSKFYGWSLEDTLNLPVSVAVAAAETKRQIEYEEFARDVAISCSPHMKSQERKKLLSKARPPKPKPVQEIIEYNPEKAKEFFKSIGAKINE